MTFVSSKTFISRFSLFAQLCGRKRFYSMLDIFFFDNSASSLVSAESATCRLFNGTIFRCGMKGNGAFDFRLQFHLFVSFSFIFFFIWQTFLWSAAVRSSSAVNRSYWQAEKQGIWNGKRSHEKHQTESSCLLSFFFGWMYRFRAWCKFSGWSLYLQIFVSFCSVCFFLCRRFLD